MSAETSTALLRLYRQFVRLVDKLPGGLHRPIINELEPIRELFLEQRAAYIELVGSSSITVPALLAAIGESTIHTGEAVDGWRDYSNTTGSRIRILDARSGVPSAHITQALAHRKPDLVIFVQDSEPIQADWENSITRACAAASPVIAVSPETVFQSRLAALIQASHALRDTISIVLSPSDPVFPESICAALPRPAQLEFARFTNARRAQALIASSLLKSFSAICGVIGLQPIPLADLPVLTALQGLMVGLIIHTTGRPVSARLIAEFLGALGFSTAAGFLFRETTRAVVRIVPFWGNAISGFIAGAGTYAIGRAAIAYFIDDSPIQETRRIFRSMLQKRSSSPTPLP